MACHQCTGNIWKQKLGRCKRCMCINLLLLLASALGSYWMLHTQPKSVQAIAMFFTLFFSALLMFLHVIAYLYYRVTGDQKNNLTEGIHNRE